MHCSCVIVYDSNSIHLDSSIDSCKMIFARYPLLSPICNLLMDLCLHDHRGPSYDTCPYIKWVAVTILQFKLWLNIRPCTTDAGILISTITASTKLLVMACWQFIHDIKFAVPRHQHAPLSNVKIQGFFSVNVGTMFAEYYYKKWLFERGLSRKNLAQQQSGEIT